MSRLKILLAAALAANLVWPGAAGAGPMLTGAVTFDRAAQLYTYSYTLDDRPAPAPVSVIEIRVATHVYDLSDRNPVGHAASAPVTDFFTAVGGWDTPEFPGGTFYEWSTPVLPDAPGVHRGLSFTSRYGPGTAGAANYTLFSSAATGPPLYRPDGFVEYGRVVAPDLTNAPEPCALALAAVGLAVVGWRGARRGDRVGRHTGQ